jgi:trypsin
MATRLGRLLIKRRGKVRSQFIPRNYTQHGGSPIGRVAACGMAVLTLVWSSASPAEPWASLSDEQRRRIAASVVLDDQPVDIVASYDACTSLGGEPVRLDLTLPLRITASVATRDAVVTTVSGSSRLTLGSIEVKAIAAPDQLSESADFSSRLNDPQLQELAQAIDASANAIVEIARVPVSRALADVLGGEYLRRLREVLEPADQDVKIEVSFDPSAWPENAVGALPPCEGDALVAVAVAGSPATEAGRGVHAVHRADPGAYRDLLMNAAGEVVAYKVREYAPAAARVATFAIEGGGGIAPYDEGRRGKIVGGAKVAIGDMRWSAAFARRSTDGRLVAKCGGTLIAASWVLTAAHCVIDSASVVVIGRTALNGSGGAERRVLAAWKHINYRKLETYDSDIALVRLDSPVDVVPATLVTQRPAETTAVTVVGWGAEEYEGPTVEQLHYVEVDVSSPDRCRDAYRQGSDHVSVNMFCANRTGKDACQGDSGGGAFAGFGTLSLAGIVSFGKGCASREHPGVYTDVVPFGAWIAEVRAAAEGVP